MNRDYFLDCRINLGYSQVRVAKDLKLDPSWISRVERDWTKGNYGVIIALASYYAIPQEDCKKMIAEKKLQKNI